MDETNWLQVGDVLDNFLLLEGTCEDLNALHEPLFLDVVVDTINPPDGSTETSLLQVESSPSSDVSDGKLLPFPCVKCPKSFQFRSRLQRHMTTHQSKQYRCNGCGKYFSRRDVMEAHMRRIHHGAGTRRLEHSPKKSGNSDPHLHPCPLCPAKLASAHHYQRHVQAHQKNQGSFHCIDCGKTFESRRKYTSHMKHHQMSSKKFECSVCGLAFLQKEFLRRHQLVHTGEKPYGCPLCEATFRQRVHLRQHQRRKHNDHQAEAKSKACSQCEKTFLTTSELKNHMLYHQSDRRMFFCQHPSCSMSFVEQRHLDRHVRRIHHGVRRYACRDCGKAFFEKYELNYHLKFLCRHRAQ